tara:strand:- start:1758 stop:2195 length:438 start_codon:yes stop_codon:yes gene_type:complete
MGFFSRLGSKISHGLEAGARLGKKVLGNVHRIGNKIATTGSKIVSGVERVPVIGQALAPVTGVVRSGLGLVKNVSDVAGKGVEMIEEAEDIVRRGGQAIRTGDVQSASEVMRRGKDLVGSAKSQLERAKQVKSDAVKIANRSNMP